MTVHTLLVTLSALVACVAVAAIVMVAAMIRIKRQLNDLRVSLDRHKQDIAGLSSVTASMNYRLTSREQRIDRLAEEVSRLDTGAPRNRNYGDAIDRVREGATPEELVNDFGLTRDEASLLVLLHAPKASDRPADG